MSGRHSDDLVMLEAARWEILRCCYYGSHLGATERMVLPHLQMHWPRVEREWLRRELDYLERGGWIAVERHAVHDWRAHLTAPGRDVVDYTAPAPAGIRRPEKYWA